MTDSVNELEVRYLTYEQTQAYIHKGHQLRAQAVHEGLVSIREMLRRAFTRAPVPAKPKEA